MLALYNTDDIKALLRVLAPDADARGELEKLLEGGTANESDYCGDNPG